MKRLISASRRLIAHRTRELRLARHWTQAELARRLHLSQSQLSRTERGDGSFTAEQFLLILKLFNVGVSHFAAAPDRRAELQNALARLGATHLYESEDVLPSEQFENPYSVVRDALASGDPRLITAVGPMLVRNVEQIRLSTLFIEVGDLDRRLAWLIENLLVALNDEVTGSPKRPWMKQYRRTAAVLSAAKGWLGRHLEYPIDDLLDRGIRSKKTLDEVRRSRSSISERWAIVTDLQPADFAEALKATRPS